MGRKLQALFPHTGGLICGRCAIQCASSETAELNVEFGNIIIVITYNMQGFQLTSLRRPRRLRREIQMFYLSVNLIHCGSYMVYLCLLCFSASQSDHSGSVPISPLHQRI